VAILDADKEGFLRSERSLTQTAGRAARNINSRVILYADKLTESIKRMMNETNRRREKQIAYNTIHNITPAPIVKSMQDIMSQTAVADGKARPVKAYIEKEPPGIAADPVIAYLPKEKIQKLIQKTRKSMEDSVKNLDFLEAARYRDELKYLSEKLAIADGQVNSPGNR
jgi:excinuclease ABC subunit B